MSRFFETLKEVGRSQLTANAGTDKPNSEELRADGLETLMAGLPDLPPVARAEAPSTELPPLTPVDRDSPRPDAPLNGSIGKEIPAAFNPIAPLIPHTNDIVILEHYRKLRTKIQQQHATQPIRSLLVASPGPGEGKTVTVINLALSYALLPSFKVLVVDGDLRKGTLGNWLGVAKLSGLSNYVDGSAQLADVVFKSPSVPMHFVTRGTSKVPATELLNSPRLADFIRRMTAHFDLVLLDSPPVNLIADTQMLANGCDGILLVARAFSTTSKAFHKMLNELSQFRIIGTVLNAGMRDNRPGYYRY